MHSFYYNHHHYFQKICETFSADWMIAMGTVGAVIVALFTPWVVNWLNSRPKNSKLIFIKTNVINQDTAKDEYEENLHRLLHVGRLVIKNEGENKAVAVEACIEKVIFEGKERENFIPMPLVWTHGQLNKTGLVVRDIYPNQTVYLDIFNHIFDSEYSDENIVIFAVAAGLGNNNLSYMNVGQSELLIKIYQESGQVNNVHLKCNYSGKNPPSFSII